MVSQQLVSSSRCCSPILPSRTTCAASASIAHRACSGFETQRLLVCQSHLPVINSASRMMIDSRNVSSSTSLAGFNPSTSLTFQSRFLQLFLRKLFLQCCFIFSRSRSRSRSLAYLELFKFRSVHAHALGHVCARARASVLIGLSDRPPARAPPFRYHSFHQYRYRCHLHCCSDISISCWRPNTIGRFDTGCRIRAGRVAGMLLQTVDGWQQLSVHCREPCSSVRGRL